jgi:hypothetical protein
MRNTARDTLLTLQHWHEGRLVQQQPLINTLGVCNITIAQGGWLAFAPPGRPGTALGSGDAAVAEGRLAKAHTHRRASQVAARPLSHQCLLPWSRRCRATRGAIRSGSQAP